MHFSRPVMFSEVEEHNDRILCEGYLGRHAAIRVQVQDAFPPLYPPQIIHLLSHKEHFPPGARTSL